MVSFLINLEKTIIRKKDHLTLRENRVTFSTSFYKSTITDNVQSLSRVQHFATPWTKGACQALLPMGFSGKNTGAGCHFLLQGIFPTQGSNPCPLLLLHCRQILYH